jgi:hypothetical protein
MRLSFLFVFGVWLLSCQEIKDCELESSTDYAILRYYEADSVSQNTKTVAFINVSEVDVSAYVISSIFDSDSTNDTVNAVALFTNPTDTLVKYLFETDSIIYDLTLDYKPHLRILYDECDPVYSYKLDTAYSTNFDSVVVRNNILDREVSTNIEVYF